MAETEDIVGAMIEIGRIIERESCFPRFVTVAGNVQDLPPCAPETANWMTVMDQLRAYEFEM